MSTVFFQGAFDVLNAGHVRAIRESAKLGELVIGLNTDSLMRWYKREPIIPFVQRKEIVEGIKGVVKVIECHEPAAINYLKALEADVYVLTKEWEQAQKEAIAWIEAKGGKVVFSPRYQDILCSTDIRNIIRERGED